jgi:hypothetical protein
MALLGQDRVVHDQHCAGAANQLLRAFSKHPLERLRRPAGGGHEVVHLLVLTRVTRAASGWMLLRSPGPINPRR